MGPKLLEVVRAQVAEFYGRFRPATGLSEEERKGIAAERERFTQELHRGLRALESPGGKIIQEFRAVMRELKSEPWSNKVPTVDALVARTRARCLHGVVRDWCPACEAFGRRVMWADGAEHPDGKSRGQLEMPDGSWWCGEHAEMAAWLTHRQRAYRRGRLFTYPPPLRMIPRDVYERGTQGPGYLEWTDGSLMSQEVSWVRARVEAWLGEALLVEPKAGAAQTGLPSL